MRTRPISHACVSLLLFGAPLTLCSQSPAPQVPTVITNSQLVIVPALVRGASGELMQTLHASDFLLTDNGVPQTVRLEEVEHQPLSIVVLMQTGGSAPREFPDYAKLGTMLTYLTAGSPYEIAIVTFDSQPENMWEFTQDVADLEDGFVKPAPGDGKAAILDAVSYGVELLHKRAANRRRILVLLSQPHDDGSVAHVEDVVMRLGEENITIECLTFSPEKAWLKDEFTKPRHENPLYHYSPEIPPLLHTFDLGKPLGVALSAMRDDTSAALAGLSGGESLPFATRSELEQQLSLLANHFAATSTLSFRPTSKQPGFHSLQLHVAGRPDLQVSARSSYWVWDDVTR